MMPGRSTRPEAAETRFEVPPPRELADFAQVFCPAGTSLDRALTHLLRHGGPARRVEIDDRGWASLDSVTRELGRALRLSRREAASGIAALVASQPSPRFEICARRIRALYGHSLPGVVAATPAPPPVRLLHGTSLGAEPKIRAEGLRAVRRSYVHLSSDLGYALAVARAHGPGWLILRIDSREAAARGVAFLTTAGHVWLAEAIPPEFIDPRPVARG